MTNAEFDAWAARHFPGGDSAAGRALELDRETIKALRLGLTKSGATYPVRRYVALACSAWEGGARDYDGVARLAQLVHQPRLDLRIAEALSQPLPGVL